MPRRLPGPIRSASLPRATRARAIAAPLLAALLGLLMASSCAAQSGSEVPSKFFGLAVQHPWDYPPIAFGNISHFTFAWGAVEAVKDSFDFTNLDSLVADAVHHGLVDGATNTVRMGLTLGLTPDWALKNDSTCTYKDAASGHFQCSAPPGTYTQMLQLAQAAYPIVHQDPYSILLTPSVTSKISKMVSWMAGYLHAGGWQYADGGAFHGYMGANGSSLFPMPEDSGSFGSIITKVTEMRAVFDTSGLAGKPMFQTEGSWGNFNVTDPDSQTAWLARYMLLQAGLSASTNLQLASWFAWADSNFGWGDIQTRSQQPTAAGTAYGQVFRWMAGATASPCSLAANGTWTCKLQRPNGYAAKAVWNANGPLSYKPGPLYDRYRDLAGDSMAGTHVRLAAAAAASRAGSTSCGSKARPRARA